MLENFYIDINFKIDLYDINYIPELRNMFKDKKKLKHGVKAM